MSGNKGQHITVETGGMAARFLAFLRQSHGKVSLASVYGLCYTSIRRECGSRLFLVQEKFIRFSLKSSRIFGTIYMYQYAISEGLKIPGSVPI